MVLIRVFLIFPLKAVAPLAYLYWATLLSRELFSSPQRPQRPQRNTGPKALLQTALVWSVGKGLSVWMALEVLFLIFYIYKRRVLQGRAHPPTIHLRPLDILRRTFASTNDIQACGKFLMGSRTPAVFSPRLTPASSFQDLQHALMPSANETNVEQLLREWDAQPHETSGPSPLNVQDRLALEAIIDDAEMTTLKHAEISGWFLQRGKQNERWPVSRVQELCRGNLAEWMTWAFFHSSPEELPEDRRSELELLIDEGAEWAGIHFPPGYNPEAQAMRLTMDPIPSQHRPLLYYIITALGFPIVTGRYLGKLGFSLHRSGTLSYWLRPGSASECGQMPVGEPREMPLVFCHGIGVNLLPYAPFIGELLRKVDPSRCVFLVSLPHISMRIKEDVPSCTEMVACLSDMLASWGFHSAHFVGHSFGSVLLAWMVKRAPAFVSRATFIDPVCFLLVKPDVCYNFMYREPSTPTQLLTHYFVARELYIAHSLSRNFFWFQNLLWPEELSMPALVVLSGTDSIVPAHSVRRYLTAYKHRHTMDNLRLLWFPDLGHGEINFGPVGLAACQRIVTEMLLMESRNT